MSSRRPLILAGMAGGAVWAVAVLWIGSRISVPLAMLQPALLGAGFAPGLVLMAMIGRLAQRRFFDDEIVDGAPLSGAAAIDQRVLTNTVEQILLALCIWPLAGFFIGAGTVLVLGISFAIARVLFWVGYHLSPPLRGLGFAASFYPTVFVGLAVLWKLVT